MKILGIDPGSRVAGYCVIEKKGKKLIYLSSGTLRFEKEDNFIQRVSLIRTKIHEIFERNRPDHVALESLIYVKSPTALIKLAQARGVMLSVITQYVSSNVFEYSPNLVKSSTSGHGHATKEVLQKSIKLILGQDIAFSSFDESDAAAVAICHALHYTPLRTKIGEQLKKEKRPLYKSKKSLADSLGHKIR